MFYAVYDEGNYLLLHNGSTAQWWRSAAVGRWTSVLTCAYVSQKADFRSVAESGCVPGSGGVLERLLPQLAPDRRGHAPQSSL
jgi:hypothetical protein